MCESDDPWTEIAISGLSQGRFVEDCDLNMAAIVQKRRQEIASRCSQTV